MSLEIIHTDKAPAAIGPFSQAIKVGSWIYVSETAGEVVLGVPLSITGKSIYFDRQAPAKH